MFTCTGTLGWGGLTKGFLGWLKRFNDPDRSFGEEVLIGAIGLGIGGFVVLLGLNLLITPEVLFGFVPNVFIAGVVLVNGSDIFLWGGLYVGLIRFDLTGPLYDLGFELLLALLELSALILDPVLLTKFPTTTLLGTGLVGALDELLNFNKITFLILKENKVYLKSL